MEACLNCAELKAEVVGLKEAMHNAASGLSMEIRQRMLLEKQLAKQAKVIEKLKNGLDDLIIYVDSDADSFGDRYWPTRNTLIEMLKETTAAERGEA